MINTSNFLKGLPIKIDDDIEIKEITNNSKDIEFGSLFLAELGIQSHGLDYLDDAKCEKASAIIYQPPYDLSKFSKYNNKIFPLKNLSEYVSEIARRFYNPKLSKNIIGITGTNGKTSVSHFISQLSGYGVIGTMGYGAIGELTELSHTTPDAVLTQKILSDILEKYLGVAMEVSSHSLVLNRVNAVPFSVAVFTNLTQDHLDFHGDMESYYLAKLNLFLYESVKTAVINIDNAWGYRLAKTCIGKNKRVLVFGKSKTIKEFDEYICIRNIDFLTDGTLFDISINVKDYQSVLSLKINILGDFNTYNILAALLSLYANGHDLNNLIAMVECLHGIKGRVEKIDLGSNRVAIIDYSHTPDALKSVLSSLRKHTDKKIYTIFGCGGDRDKSKRPLMAEAVNNYSDIGIITDDNPRTEKSSDIIDDILKGNIDKNRFHVIESRKKSIRYALSQLSDNDILLIAGKGHESYQIIGNKKKHFSDHDVVRQWLQEKGI